MFAFEILAGYFLTWALFRVTFGPEIQVAVATNSFKAIVITTVKDIPKTPKRVVSSLGLTYKLFSKIFFPYIFVKEVQHLSTFKTDEQKSLFVRLYLGTLSEDPCPAAKKTLNRLKPKSK